MPWTDDLAAHDLASVERPEQMRALHRMSEDLVAERHEAKRSASEFDHEGQALADRVHTSEVEGRRKCFGR